MRTVPTIATRVLDGRAFFARSWAGGWAIVSEKEILVVDKALTTVGRIEISAKPEDIALTSDGTKLVVADAHTLHVREVSRPGTRWSVSGNFIGCHAASGVVWAAKGHDHRIEVTVRDPVTGNALRTTILTDPFGSSAVMFFAHPDPRSAVVWLAAGQDGQTAYLASDDGTTIETTEIPPRDRLPPTFLPDGTYLSGNDDGLEHRRWPTGDVIAHLPWPTALENEDWGGSCIDVLPGGFASWSSANGRLHVVDLVQMRIVDELTIAGHPVRTTEDMYPRLRGNKGLCGDFGYSQLGPDGLTLTVHAQRQLAISRLSDWSPDPRRRSAIA